MAHNDQHVDVHHVGDSHELRVTVENENEIPVNISDGSAHWLLFESAGDAHDDLLAVLEKQAEHDVNNDDDSEIFFVEPTDGRLIVNIETGDTGDLIDWDQLDDEADDEDVPVLSQAYHHRLRVTVDGDRATVLHGDFILYR